MSGHATAAGAERALDEAARLHAAGCHVDALASAERASTLLPNSEAAQVMRATTLMALARYEEAEAILERVTSVDPLHAQAHTLRAICMLVRGNFDAGWGQFEWREGGARHAAPRRGALPASPVALARAPRRWLGPIDAAGDLAGRSVVLDHEQEDSDTLLFARYGRLLRERGVRVTLRARPALVRLLSDAARSFGLADAVVNDDDALGAADWQCPLMSLPYVFRTGAGTIPAEVPYLLADPRLVQHWRARLGPDPRPRVGLVWSAGRHGAYPAGASLDPAQLAALHVPGVRLLALQAGDAPAAPSRGARQRGIERPAGDPLDLADVAALITHCDLVIGVDSTALHLAGAMNRPAWLLLPYAAHWRWQLGRDDSPWYLSLRLFRQPAPGDWAGVLARVGAALARRWHGAMPAPGP